MLREHAPLIAVAVATAVLFYLVFRSLRSLREALEAVSSQCAATPDLATPLLVPAAESPQVDAPKLVAPAAAEAAAAPATNGGGAGKAASTASKRQ